MRTVNAKALFAAATTALLIVALSPAARADDDTAQPSAATRIKQDAKDAGHAIARDATTQTQAHRIVFHQDNGDIFADGGVRSTDFTAKASAVQLTRSPKAVSRAKFCRCR